jgi:adenylosuccinate lyase
VLLAATKRGADRQEMHERLRQHSLSAWKAVQSGDPNPLGALISNDPQIVKYLAAGELDALLDASRHIGDAPQRARRLVETVRQAIGV